MDYNYSILVNYKVVSQFYHLNRGIEAFIINVLLGQGNDVSLINNFTGEVLFDYSPTADSLNDILYIASTIEEV